jgi:MFS family permease
MSADAPPDVHVQVAPLDPERLGRVVVVLSLTEIVSWGVLFYAFTVLASSIEAAEGWPLTDLMAVFTMTQLVAAAAGLWVGRRLDRVGPRLVMTGGSVLGVCAVVGIALAPGFELYVAAWVVAGLAMSATLYAPAFTVLTHWAGAGRVRALTTVTLVAGFASTVFAPLAALLESVGSWRSAYLVLAVPLSATVALHWWGLRDPWVAEDLPAASTGPDGGRVDVQSGPRRLEFAVAVAAFTVAGFCVYAVVINLVPLLREGGLSTVQAGVALGVGGAGQVAGRLLYAPFLDRIPVRPRTVGVLAAASVTTLAVAFTSRWVVAALAASFAAGLVRGIFTLIQATAVSDRWGTRDFGARTAVLTGSVMAAAAFAPWLGSLLAVAVGGYAGAFVLLAVAGALAAVAIGFLPSSAGREQQRTRGQV